MAFIQIVVLSVAGLVAYYYSKSRRVLWKSILGIVSGFFLGIFVGLLVISIFGETTDDMSNNSTYHGIREVITYASEKPIGSTYLLVEELPNSILVFGVMYVGAKIGGVLGTLATPLGTAIGTISGGVLGLFFGNIMLETGYLAMDRMRQEGTMSKERMEEIKLDGIKKSAYPIGINYTTLMRQLGYIVWFSLFGSVGGFIYGRRHHKFEIVPNKAHLIDAIEQTGESPSISNAQSDKNVTLREQLLQPQMQYPKWVAHLRKRVNRLIYSLLPFTVLFFIFLEMSYELPTPVGIIIICVVLTAITYVLLTVVVRIASVWREPKSKIIRLWCFGFAYWIACVLVFVLLLGPYYGIYLSDMYMDEYIHMFMVMLLPPLLIGSAIYVYDKFIREEDRPQTISAGKAEFDLPEDPIKKTITVEQMTTQPGIIVLERQQQKVWSLGKVMSFCLIISVAIIYFYWGKIQDYSGPTGAQLEVERQRVVEEKLEEMRKLAEDDGMATIQSGPVMGRYTEAITEVMRRKGEKEKLLRQRSRDVVDAGEYESWRKRYKEFLYKMEQYDHAITEEVSKGHVQTAEALYLPEWERQQQEEDRRKADEKKARAELDKLFKEHEINWYDWHSP